MVQIAAILDAVSGRVSTAFPVEKVYTNRVREGFKRPACLVQAGKMMILGGSQFYQDRVLDLSIITFVDVDERHDSHYETLISRAETIAGLFFSRTLPVGNRALLVGDITCSYELDYAEVKVMLSWSEDISQIETAEIAEHAELRQNILRR